MERKLTAILSADVAGYSRLMAADDEGTVRALEACREEIGRIAEEQGGRVVDATGDSVLAEFPSALAAVEAGVQVQRSVAARDEDLPEERRMLLRIGIHVGDVMVEGERIYGDGVNIAARLQALAEPGAICVSGTVREQVHRRLDVGLEDLGPRRVKNIPDPVPVYRLRLDAAPAPRPAPGDVDAASLSGLSGRSDVAVLVVPAVWISYVAIVCEILFMISPAALYYYSAYGPSLNLLHASPATAWLTAFFLPHFSMTSSAVLDALPTLGMVLIIAGLALFAAGFVQIYGGKLRGSGPVTGGLYTLARHPQYLALAVLGMGTLLVWPRFLVLLAYASMLFLYVLLARHEEARCLREFGDAYRAYWERTGLLLPRRLLRPGALPWPESRGARTLAGAALYAFVILGLTGTGFALREYSLGKISALYEDEVAILSPARLDQAELRAAYELASTDPRVGERLAAAGARGKLLVYVVPLEWALADLPLIRPEERIQGHHVPADFDRDLYKILFTRARTHDPEGTREQIVRSAYGREPLVQVEIDAGARAVTAVRTPPPHVLWGDIPTPLF